MSTKTTPRRIWIAFAAICALALVSAASASAKDRNHDRIPDRWEKQNGLSLNVNQARKDQDADALRNRGEFKADMDPHDADTDDDGVTDGDEGAGTITAWDPITGELTIGLFGGKEVAGLVTSDTEIECENDDPEEPDVPSAPTARDFGGPSGPGGPSAPGGPSDSGPGPNSGPGGPAGAGMHDCDGNECSVDDLAIDRVVDEAGLKLTADGLVFDEIELAPVAESAPAS